MCVCVCVHNLGGCEDAAATEHASQFHLWHAVCVTYFKLHGRDSVVGGRWLTHALPWIDAVWTSWLWMLAGGEQSIPLAEKKGAPPGHRVASAPLLLLLMLLLLLLMLLLLLLFPRATDEHASCSRGTNEHASSSRYTARHC